MEERLKRIMADIFKLSPKEINDDTSPDNVKEWDSLGQINMALAIEVEFNVSLSDEDILAMKNYGLIKIILHDLGVQD